MLYEFFLSAMGIVVAATGFVLLCLSIFEIFYDLKRMVRAKLDLTSIFVGIVMIFGGLGIWAFFK